MTKRNMALLLLFIVLTGGGAWYFLSGNAGGHNRIDISDAEFVAHGKTLYARECAACHGKNLEGQTPNWRRPLPDGSFPAPPHNASGHTWHHPDSVLFEITKYGRLRAAPRSIKSNMPAFEEMMSDRDIWATLAYIKSQWPAQVRQRHDAINRRHGAAH